MEKSEMITNIIRFCLTTVDMRKAFGGRVGKKAIGNSEHTQVFSRLSAHNNAPYPRLLNIAYNYMGLFIDDVKSFYKNIDDLLEKNSIERHKYDKEIPDPHVTLRHESENKPFLDDLFKIKIPVTITHYGYDDDLGNEGVKIKFKNLPSNDDLDDMIKSNGKRIGGMDKYHITLSMETGAQAKNTKDIKKWQELETPMTVNMVMDGFVK